jgi:RNA polymerase sigma-70 factor (ECF subfamily)
MTEEEFRRFHSATAVALRAYLARTSGDEALADDIVQSAYVRFLRTRERPCDFSAQRVYLFRTALNLLRDEYRRARSEDRRTRTASAAGTLTCAADLGGSRHSAVATPGLSIETRLEVRRALDEVTSRDRELLWLAYVTGMTHREIAAILDVGEASVRVLLLRARRRLALVLQAHGVGPEDMA